jgi:hypothetical protein
MNFLYIFVLSFSFFLANQTFLFSPPARASEIERLDMHAAHPIREALPGTGGRYRLSIYRGDAHYNANKSNNGISGIYRDTLAYSKTPLFHPYEPIDNPRDISAGIASIPLIIHFPTRVKNLLPSELRREIEAQGISDDCLKIFLSVQNHAWTRGTLLSFRPQYAMDPTAPQTEAYNTLYNRTRIGFFHSEGDQVRIQRTADLHAALNPPNILLDDIPLSTHPANGRNVLSGAAPYIRDLDYDRGSSFWSYIGYRDPYDHNKYKGIITLQWVLNDNQEAALSNEIARNLPASPTYKNIDDMFKRLRENAIFSNREHFAKLLPLWGLIEEDHRRAESAAQQRAQAEEARRREALAAQQRAQALAAQQQQQEAAQRREALAAQQKAKALAVQQKQQEAARKREEFLAHQKARLQQTQATVTRIKEELAAQQKAQALAAQQKQQEAAQRREALAAQQKAQALAAQQKQQEAAQRREALAAQQKAKALAAQQQQKAAAQRRAQLAAQQKAKALAAQQQQKAAAQRREALAAQQKMKALAAQQQQKAAAQRREALAAQQKMKALAAQQQQKAAAQRRAQLAAQQKAKALAAQQQQKAAAQRRAQLAAQQKAQAEAARRKAQIVARQKIQAQTAQIKKQLTVRKAAKAA